jgi:hypothetical protein
MSDDTAPLRPHRVTRTLTLTTVETWTITIGGEASGPPEEQRAAQIDLNEQTEQESIQREEA